jgi:5'-deoxynucleotidase YfbR-like HD superfamily hydrolase
MSTRAVMPWIQTASGRALDLIAPASASVDLGDVAEHLSKIARYAGATQDSFYSVAQHCCYAADEVFQITGDRAAAAEALFHDDHEYAIGDDTTPKQRALTEIAREMFGDDVAEKVAVAQKALRYRLSAAIHTRFGLQWPPASSVQTLVKRIDLQMLETERRDLLAPSDRAWTPTGYEPLPFKVVPWDWQFARHCFRIRFNKYVEVTRDIEVTLPPGWLAEREGLA